MFGISKREKFLIAIIVLLVIGMSGTFYINSKDDETVIKASNVKEQEESSLEESEKKEPKEEKSETDEEIAVYICGAVRNPGVYRIENGMRLSEVLSMSGGLSDGADLTSVNLAKKLTDEEKIYIPKIGEKADNKLEVVQNAAAPSNKASEVKAPNSKVNINTATLSELDTLPGIGPAYAQRIIDYRTSNGGFKSVDEIKEVPGIGDKKYESIKALITVN